MKKSLTILLAAGVMLATSFKIEDPRFYITGNIDDCPDSTVLFLSDLTDGSFKDMDSTIVIGRKFSFTGIIKQKAMKVAIRTRDFSDRTYFWLENSLIKIAGSKGNFKNAIVAGSKTQDEQYKLNGIIKTATDKEAQYVSYIKQYPSSIISAELLSIYSSSWHRNLVSLLHRHLSKEMRNTAYGKKVAEFLALNKDPKVGDKYTDFAQTDINGKTVKLSDFQGKLVLLEFWGSWCGPCRKDNPGLVKTYNEFKDKGFEILGVAADNRKEEWLEAVRNDGLPWPNVCDLNGDRNKAALIYGISYYPANFLIDKTGTIIAKDLRGGKLRDKLRQLLK